MAASVFRGLCTRSTQHQYVGGQGAAHERAHRRHSAKRLSWRGRQSEFHFSHAGTNSRARRFAFVHADGRSLGGPALRLGCNGGYQWWIISAERKSCASVRLNALWPRKARRVRFSKPAMIFLLAITSSRPAWKRTMPRRLTASPVSFVKRTNGRAAFLSDDLRNSLSRRYWRLQRLPTVTPQRPLAGGDAVACGPQKLHTVTSLSRAQTDSTVKRRNE